jgi:hypothetical protein
MHLFQTPYDLNDCAPGVPLYPDGKNCRRTSALAATCVAGKQGWAKLAQTCQTGC